MEEWREYLDSLASKAAVPGGGGASAVCGALGAALGEMVGNLTTGKKKYAEWEEQTQAHIARLTELRERLAQLAKEDELAFEPLSRAYGIKAETDEEKEKKAQYMEACLRNAAAVPIRIMETCGEAFQDVLFFAEYGSRLAVSDAGVGAAFLNAALSGAVLNVYINTKLMKDRKYAEELNAHADRLLEDGRRAAAEVYEIVTKAVRV